MDWGKFIEVSGYDVVNFEVVFGELVFSVCIIKFFGVWEEWIFKEL